MSGLGCTYRANTKAWMTQAIFSEWIKYFDRRMSGRKVILVLDNCSAHSTAENLSSLVELRNTTVLYLPPNMTSKIQPCDAGIIRNFKAYYRQRFNRLLIDGIQNNCSNPEKINVLQGICMAVDAWTINVKQATIRNCFLHCKIRDAVVEEEQPLSSMEDDSLTEELTMQSRLLGYSDPMTVEHLLDFPEEQYVSFTPTDEDIVAFVTNATNDSDRDDDEVEANPERPIISAREASYMITEIEHLLLQHPTEYAASSNALQILRKQCNIISQSRCRQTNLFDYFATPN